MALSDIINAIVSEAETEATDIQNKADAQIKNIYEKLEADITAAQTATAAETERRQHTMEQKIAAHVQSEYKREEVALKTRMLKEVQAKALQKLQSLPEQEQVQMVQNILADIGETGTIHPAKGQKELVEKAIKAADKSFDMGDEADIAGGFLFVGEKVDIDGSYEALLKTQIMPSVESEVTAILFG